MMERRSFRPADRQAAGEQGGSHHHRPLDPPPCQFDEAGCSEGLRRLKSYRKEWDDLRGVWKERPTTTTHRTPPTGS